MNEHSTTQSESAAAHAPSPSQFTSSPLRNRLRLELDAPVSRVWELLGDLARFPEYSVGLERVDVKQDEAGRCVEYTCYFKPPEAGAPHAVSRNVMKWYEPNRGYLSVEVEGDAGTDGAVALTTLDPIPRGTRLTSDMHFDAEDNDAAKAQLDEALGDIAENLIRRFGGTLTERYVEV